MNRLTNLLGGLEAGGKKALEDMRLRGNDWLTMADEMERPVSISKAHRPSPKPPVEARPHQLSVTAIKTLIRDPYAIYARNILGLKSLDPLVQLPDAPLRGTLIHKILEVFVKDRQDETPEQSKQRLLEITDTILAQNAPWPTARAIWRSKVERVADWFIARESARQTLASSQAFETDGSVTIPELDFRLTAQADRIYRDVDGGLHIIDYKTGKPPSNDVQKSFDKQLLLEAAMAQLGGFPEVGGGEVGSAIFIGLGSTPSEIPAPLNDTTPEETWDGLRELLERYFDPNTGYSSRRAMQKEGDEGRYDHLARFGEWDIADAPMPEVLKK